MGKSKEPAPPRKSERVNDEKDDGDEPPAKKAAMQPPAVPPPAMQALPSPAQFSTRLEEVAADMEFVYDSLLHQHGPLRFMVSHLPGTHSVGELKAHFRNRAEGAVTFLQEDDLVSAVVELGGLGFELEAFEVLLEGADSETAALGKAMTSSCWTLIKEVRAYFQAPPPL